MTFRSVLVLVIAGGAHRVTPLAKDFPGPTRQHRIRSGLVLPSPPNR